MSYDPGIISLGGYAYQIRVFVLMLSRIEQNISVGFELIDDISLTDKNIDKHSEEISNVLKDNLKYTAIQVKKTKITNTNYKKILYNWLLEYDKYKTDISQLKLYTDKTLNSSFNLNSIDADLLHKKLTLINNNDEYTYNFSESINYFRGKNDTGKTEFYKFIDYMFASSTDISGKEWFKKHLTRAKLIFEFNNINYELTRSLDGKHNLFKVTSKNS